MPLDPQAFGEFRARLTESQAIHRDAWPASRRLIAPANFEAALATLVAAVQASSLPAPVRAALQAALREGRATRMQDLQGEVLKQLTGLPPTKAFRALCLLFGLAEAAGATARSALSPVDIEAFVRRHRNPFDLLLDAEVPSVLELGAGDLSFAAALVQQYLPLMEGRGKALTVHCLDRLRSGSGLGGLYQADPHFLAQLRAEPPAHLEFRYWGDQDMF